MNGRWPSCGTAGTALKEVVQGAGAAVAAQFNYAPFFFDVFHRLSLDLRVLPRYPSGPLAFQLRQNFDVSIP